MKVGVFLGDLSADIGGGHTFQQELCRAIELYGPESKHEFVLFTYSHRVSLNVPGGVKFITIARNVNRSQLSMLCRNIAVFWGGVISRRIKIKALERILDPISAHITEESVDITWSLIPGCFSAAVPFITTLWDLEHRNQPYFPEVSVEGEWDSREKGYSSLLGKAAYVITGTKAGAMEIEKFYHVPSDRVRVLPFPTPQFTARDCSENDQKVLEKYGIPESYLFYPAQFWPHKNHYGVLMSLLALREKYGLSLSAVFVGSDKGNLSYIKTVVKKLGLTKQVHFLGFVPREDLSALYRHAFALLYLSFFGPDNLPPLEAFALGCPVIASNVSGAQEQLGEAALLVDPKDPTNIAAAINRLMQDDALRATLTRRGFERASLWTGDDYFKGVCSILDEFEHVRRAWSSSERFKLVR